MVMCRAKMPYRWIALVMWLYHAQAYSPDTWRDRLRSVGAEPRHYKNSKRVPPQNRTKP